MAILLTLLFVVFAVQPNMACKAMAVIIFTVDFMVFGGIATGAICIVAMVCVVIQILALFV